MSILSDKYKIPEPTIKNMIQDGVISCSWIGYENVIQMYREGKTISEIAFLSKMSERHVKRIISKSK